MVKFKLFPTAGNIELASEWTDNTDGNTIRVSEGSVIEAFTNMVVITEPEITTGADGELELEFEGQPSL